MGDAAKNQAATNPTNTIFDVKRLIGRKFSDASVQKDAKLFPYKVSKREQCSHYPSILTYLHTCIHIPLALPPPLIECLPALSPR